jgi:hypothetical protein
MQAHRRWRRPIGALLLLPLAAVLVDGLLRQNGCDLAACGDEARGTYVLMLGTAAPAAIGLSVLVMVITLRYLGGPSRSGSFYLFVAVFLAPMTIVAVLALGATWRKSRAS